ncbi:MAG: hypothetical protein WA584_08610 [Pyrinomonadaceae bacterium]
MSFRVTRFLPRRSLDLALNCATPKPGFAVAANLKLLFRVAASKPFRFAATGINQLCRSDSVKNNTVPAGE